MCRYGNALGCYQLSMRKMCHCIPLVYIKGKSVMVFEWQKIGVIGVDAGLCWVGDPCYIIDKDASDHPCISWSEFCEKLDDSLEVRWKQWNYKAGHAGLGVTVQTGYGDGTYPVSVKVNNEGRVLAVMVDFSEGEITQ